VSDGEAEVSHQFVANFTNTTCYYNDTVFLYCK